MLQTEATLSAIPSAHHHSSECHTFKVNNPRPVTLTSAVLKCSETSETSEGWFNITAPPTSPPTVCLQASGLYSQHGTAWHHASSLPYGDTLLFSTAGLLILLSNSGSLHMNLIIHLTIMKNVRKRIYFLRLWRKYIGGHSAQQQINMVSKVMHKPCSNGVYM